jgi:hypothetical protein
VTQSVYADVTSMGKDSPDDDNWDDITDESVKSTPGPIRNKGAGGGTGARRGRRPAAKKLEGLQQRLSGEMFAAGTMIGFGLPTTGIYICQESDAFTKAVVELASSRAEWINALEHLASIEPGVIIGRTVFGIGAAIAVDREKIEPDRRLLGFLGVTQAYMKVHEKGPVMEEGSAYTPPPATFRPI